MIKKSKIYYSPQNEQLPKMFQKYIEKSKQAKITKLIYQQNYSSPQNKYFSENKSFLTPNSQMMKKALIFNSSDIKTPVSQLKPFVFDSSDQNEILDNQELQYAEVIEYQTQKSPQSVNKSEVCISKSINYQEDQNLQDVKQEQQEQQDQQEQQEQQEQYNTQQIEILQQQQLNNKQMNLIELIKQKMNDYNQNQLSYSKQYAQLLKQSIKYGKEIKDINDNDKLNKSIVTIKNLILQLAQVLTKKERESINIIGNGLIEYCQQKIQFLQMM